MSKRKPPITRDAALAAMRAIYDDLAARPIERSCVRRTECCQFKLTGRTPYVTAGEILAAATALRAAGRTRAPVRDDGVCPLLSPDGQCMVYDDRPFGCRTHFCAAAGGPYARREVVDLIHRLEDLDRQLGGSGAMLLPAALARAMRETR